MLLAIQLIADNQRFAEYSATINYTCRWIRLEVFAQNSAVCFPANYTDRGGSTLPFRQLIVMSQKREDAPSLD